MLDNILSKQLPSDQPSTPESAGPPGRPQRKKWVAGGAAAGAVLGVALANDWFAHSASQPEKTYTVSAPEALDGYQRITDPAVEAKLRQALDPPERTPGVHSSVAAAYGPGNSEDTVVVIALAARAKHPDQDLSRDMDNLRTAYGLTARTVDAGPQGGSARCATGSPGGLPTVVCEWIDTGSFGRVSWTGKPAANAESRFHAIRARIEHTK